MESINSFLPSFSSTLISEKNQNSYVVTLTEETASISSNSFLCMMIAFYLKSSFNVILFAEKESLHHYSTILKKFSLNLNTNNAFCFIDIQSAYSSIIKTEFPLSENYPYTYSPNRSKHYISCSTMLINNKINYEVALNALNETLELKLQKENNKTIVILDYTLQNSNDLNLITKFCIDNDFPIVLTVNHEILYDNSIREYYNYISDIDISFKPNESGHSKDIDGIIKIALKSFDDDNNTSSNETSSLNQSTTKHAVLRYSVKENNINFFTHFII